MTAKIWSKVCKDSYGKLYVVKVSNVSKSQRLSTATNHRYPLETCKQPHNQWGGYSERSVEHCDEVKRARGVRLKEEEEEKERESKEVERTERPYCDA